MKIDIPPTDQLGLGFIRAESKRLNFGPEHVIEEPDPRRVDAELLAHIGHGDVDPAMWSESDERYEWLAGRYPVMTTFWPAGLAHNRDREAAARAMLVLAPSCTLITLRGDPHIGLTGGGENLSWDIAGAYIALGQCPPIGLLLGLPKFAGDTLDTAPNRRPVLDSMAVARAFLMRFAHDMETVETVLRQRLTNPLETA